MVIVWKEKLNSVLYLLTGSSQLMTNCSKLQQLQEGCFMAHKVLEAVVKCCAATPTPPCSHMSAFWANSSHPWLVVKCPTVTWPHLQSSLPPFPESQFESQQGRMQAEGQRSAEIPCGATGRELKLPEPLDRISLPCIERKINPL